jgi:hypothetical protein
MKTTHLQVQIHHGPQQSEDGKAIKTHRTDRGRCRDRGRYHPIAEGVNTTETEDQEASSSFRWEISRNNNRWH